jgi:hypothetical protein
MPSFKKNYLQRDFSAGAYPSEAQNSIPSSLTHCIRVYSVQYTGKGEKGGDLTREKGREATVNKAGSKIPT